MSQTPNFDAKIKTILDATVPGERVCELTGEKWMMDKEEIGWYRKFNVPPSKYSPLARMKLLYSYFIVFDVWYNRHAETGKLLVSTIHPATGIRVLPDTEWFAKDFSSLGLNLDLAKPFFDQFYRLGRTVPRAAGYNFVPPEHSLAFLSFGDRDSYFVLASQTERCFSCTNVSVAQDCTEAAMMQAGTLSCNILHSNRIFQSAFVRESYDCMDCRFIFDCRDCEHCFMAANKRHKKYLFFNEQLSKEEWERRVAEIDLSSWVVRQKYEQKFHEFLVGALWPENFNVNEERSLGEYLNGCIDCRECYYLSTPGSEHLDHVTYGLGDTPSHDVYLSTGSISSSDSYNSVGINRSSQIKFALSVNADGFDCEYCESCFNCEHCFGCVGLRHKKFCILNKQYTEEGYGKMLDELKCAMLERGEYGDLPPAKFSTQVCETSGLGVVYSATPEECRLFGAAEIKPSDEGAEGPVLDPVSIRPISEIPDRIVPEDIETVSKKTWWDEHMGRRFAYLKPELELYQRLNIAPPRAHPTRRIVDLYQQMNMPIFEERACASCGKGVAVAKNAAYPSRKIYCKSCYLQYLEHYG